MGSDTDTDSDSDDDDFHDAEEDEEAMALELTEEERAIFRLEGEEKDEEDGEGVELTMGVDDLSDESSADEDQYQEASEDKLSPGTHTRVVLEDLSRRIPNSFTIVSPPKGDSSAAGGAGSEEEEEEDKERL